MASRDELEKALGRVPSANDVYGAGDLPALNIPRRRERVADGQAIQQAQAMVKQGDAYHVRDFVLTRRGLTVPETASDEDFVFVMGYLLDIGDRIQLWLGDLLVAIGIRYGTTYQAIAEWSGREVKTLQNYKSVCERIESSLRKEDLTFGHYNIIAGLDEGERPYWIEKASSHGWSIAELRRAIKDSKGEVLPVEGVWQRFEKAVKIEGVLEVAQSASEQERRTMAEQLRVLADMVERGEQ